MSDRARGSRPSMPADLRRQVLVEAGHRCAIPTCRHIEVEIHHIVPWAKYRKHSYDNLIALCPNCHRRAHRSQADRNRIDRKSLRLYKHNLRFALDKFSQFELDVLFAAHAHQPDQPILLPNFMCFIINRILDAGYVKIVSQGGGVLVGGMGIHPVHLCITDEGRKFIENIGLKEM